MLNTMTLAEARAEAGLSMQGLADILGLKSKSYIADIEGGKTCSAAVALEIEKWSKGKVPASTLSPDVRLVEAARGLTDAA